MALTPFPAIPGGAQPGAMTPGDPGVGGSPGTLLNQWPVTLTGDPGLAIVQVANRDGSALVAYIGWSDETYPLFNIGNVTVTDDAHNYWQPLVAEQGLGIGTGGGIRGAIWIATNADPATVVSISSSSPVSGLCGLVGEFPGLPNLVNLDFSQTTSTNSGTSLSLSRTATVADWAFGMVVVGSNTATITEPGGVWTALNQVNVNTLGLGDMAIAPVYAQVNAGTVSATFGASISLPMDAVMAGIKQTSASVTNSNHNWPVFQVQAAFGADPMDGMGGYTWTDITSRAYYDDTSAILDVSRGRSYELTSPVAGTIQLWLANNDGALTPSNTASPYYPNVLPQTPIRIIATWNNEVYPVATGQVDKWPQVFTGDTPQWGMTNLSASDSMGVLANLTMYSAYQSEVLADNPYSYWPFGESYGTANGLPFDNLGGSVTNNKPMVGFNGQGSTPVTLSTGLTLNMQGDPGGGIGISGLNASATNWAAGAICLDPGLPQLINSLTVEFWSELPLQSSLGGVTFTTPLLSLLGSPTNFASGGGPVRFQAAAISGSPNYTLKLTFADYLGNKYTNSSFTCPGDGNLHHHVITMQYQALNWSVTHYLDGALDGASFNTSGITTNNDISEVVVGPALITPLNNNPFNYTMAHVAIYAGVLDNQRITAHFNAGSTGFINDTGLMRFKRIVAWSQTGLSMAGTLPSAAPLMGAAFNVSGQAATDAFNDLLTSEGGWPYADASGNTWWASRTSFYNRSPKWLFGDNPIVGGTSGTPIGNIGVGLIEIPYDPSTSFDFDNNYLYTQVLATREINQSTQITTSPTQGANAQTFINAGAIVRVSSSNARGLYGNRNALAQNILTASDQDAYDRAYWSLQKYSSSSLRIPEIIIDAASNPVLWPVVLGVEQGDIVEIIRRPLGAAVYTVMGIVVSVHIEINVANNLGRATLGVVPYNIESSIIQVDNPGYDTLASGIGW